MSCEVRGGTENHGGVTVVACGGRRLVEGIGRVGIWAQ